MKTLSFLSLAVVSLSLSAVACTASSSSDDAPAAGEEQDIVTTRTSVILGEEDNGLTATVKAGQSVILELPSNPSTGYAWQVVATNRTFGYPTEEFVGPDSNAVGAGGTQKLTWKTSGPLPMIGSHPVTLEYRRPSGGPAAQTFTFTADVVRSAPPAPSGGVTLGAADNGKTVDVGSGKDVVVELESNASTGYSWDVVQTDRTFGYPAEEFVAPAGNAVGASGKQRFTWKTSGPLPMTGRHTVKLDYRRPWQPDQPAESFTFTVNVR